METTNAVFNLTLYDVIKPETVMSWIRVIVSNRMASSGSEWVNLMANYNSGTYNNQWMVVDFKLWQQGMTQLAPNTLWIGSQMPGYFESADVTNVINSQGYWPSYNVPYFPKIFEISGYAYMEKIHGNFFSYEECPRAMIFRKKQAEANTLSELQTLMRYNDWEHDPLSLGCPLNQIASRLDLAPSNSTAIFCSPAAFGAINGKITSASQVPQLQASIIGGPTHDTQPVFAWTSQVSEQFATTFHYGQPQSFDFDWMTVQPTN